MAREKSIEYWKLVPLPKITTTSTVGGEPFFPFFPYHSVPPKHIKSLPPFVPPISYDSFPTEDPRLQCHLKRTSSAKVYGWNFPPQGSSTQLSDNSSPKPPDEEDISALSIDEHAGCSSSSVNIDAVTMNKTTCDGEFSKPPPPPPGDGEFNQPPGETIKPPPLGDSIPFTAAGSQEGRCARDSSSSSSSACYMCGEAQHFARKCSSLGANTTA